MTTGATGSIVYTSCYYFCEWIISLHNMIGERLRHIMAERGLSAAQLAKTADVKPSFIYDVIHGKSTNPSIVKLAQIAKVLEVDISSLIGGHVSPTSKNTPVDLADKLRKSPSPSNGNDDYVTISSILVEASMGVGAIVSTEENGKPYYFRKEWIRNRLGVSPADLRMIFVRGDSMEPSLCANDMILIDITKKSPTPPGIFVLFDGFGLVAKRLEFISNTNPPALRIISDNAQYSAYERTIDELHIIGRVVWFAREL